jgi:hypothetical protein
MPRDGDPMNQKTLSLAPVPQEPPTRSPSAPRLAPRVGQKALVLTASNGRGGELKFVFARTRAGIEFWRSLDADRSSPTLVRTFGGPFTARAVADLLASGEAGPAIDEADVEEAAVAGTDGRWSNLIRLAWSRVAGKTDPRVPAVLSLSDKHLDEVDHRWGFEHDVDDYLKLGNYLVEHGQAWLVDWRPEIDLEVARRAGLEERTDDEVRCRAHRVFVETCLLTLGRMPRANESAEAWDGMRFRARSVGTGTRRRLGLESQGRIGKYRVGVVFWAAVESYGYPDMMAGPGWFWVTRNPDPGWLNDGPMGPYKSADEAWEDAKCLDQQD